MLKRFQIDDPAFLAQVGERLKLALRQAGGRGHGPLSVTLVLPEIALDGPPASLREAFYWSRPAAQCRLLGIGSALAVEGAGVDRWHRLGQQFDAWRAHWRHVDADGSGLRPLAVGGFSFDGGGAAGFPAARLAIPALLLRPAGAASALTFSFDGVAGEASVEAAMRRLAALASPLRAARRRQRLTRLRTMPEDSRWLDRVRLAVTDIQAGHLDKVVLSRCATVRAARPFDPARVMSELARHHPRSTLFGLDADGDAFVGASPELLAGLRKGNVYCDALAGTVWGEAGEEQLCDVKNGREHRLVVQALEEALRPLCSLLEVPAAPVALDVGNLRHLRSVLRGHVKPGVGLLDLLRCVHPTPAVGGYPRDAALDWLARNEETRPAWYTGAVGWIDVAGDGEFAVALRCGVIRGDHADVYAGAGIVAGSEPELELAETEAKLAAMLEALAASGI